MSMFGGRVDDGASSFSINPRILIALVIAGVSLIGYFANTQVNPVTGKKQHISISTKEEIAMGLQTAPAIAAKFGGQSANSSWQQAVDTIGRELVAALPDEYPDFPYEFHVLADAKTVNAFALPGGQIFITEALMQRLETPGQLAGVLGHEMGHVLGRHSAEQMSKAKLASGLATATGVGASSDYNTGRAAGAIANQVAGFWLLKYGRSDELESDKLGVRFMASAGYDPRSLIEVMKILEQASGGGGGPEFMATHPNPGNRIEHIKAHIAEMFPRGLPRELQP